MSKKLPTSSYTHNEPEREECGRHRFSFSDGHLIHAKKMLLCSPRNVAFRSTTVQPHNLGESIGQSAMQFNAR
jgi:hypothetical protein